MRRPLSLPSPRGGRVLFLFVALLLLPAGAWAQEARVTLLHINDVYEIQPQRGKGGLAELMTLLQKERGEHQHTITTVGGDFLSPSIMSSLFKGAQMIDLFNALGVDMVVFGNHEFDLGPAITRERIAQSRFPWLGANVLGPDGKPFGGAVATLTRDVDGVRLGFLGVLTPDTGKMSSPGPEIRFAPPVEAARQAVEALKADGARVIVALTHLDIADDRALARAVPGIHVILGGHDHDPVTYYERDVLILKAGSDAHFLAAIDLDIKADKDRVVVQPQWRMTANAGTVPEPDVAALVRRYADRLDAELGEVVGRTEVELDTRAATVRRTEARFGNLVADAMRERLGADAAITNGGGIRGNRVIAAGAPISRKDVIQELPFGNLAVLIELKGADLKAALEHGVSGAEHGAGRFPQISGMTVEYDVARPAGDRVTKLTVSGKPLDPDAAYRVATSDYMAGGGDGYAALARGKPLTDARAAPLLAAVVTDWIAARKTVAPQLEGRIVAKP